MVFPAISPAQAIQLGVAAQAAGSAAASAFAGLLRSAASLLAPSATDEASPNSASPTPRAASGGGTTDLAVLSGQIDSLLSQIADRVRQLFAGGNCELPSGGVTLEQGSSGDLTVSGQGSQGPQLSRLLQQDGLLQSLFRSLAARRQLFASATSPGETAGPMQLHVDAGGMRTVTA